MMRYKYLSSQIYYCPECDSFKDYRDTFVHYENILHISNYEIKLCNICKYYEVLKDKPKLICCILI